MTVRIQGTPVHCFQTRQALQIVARNPGAYGIPPQDIQRRGADVDFTQDQVIQILNPASPERREVNFRDRDERTRQGTAPLNERQFAALAQEFAHRFPNTEEARRSIWILPDLLSSERASCFPLSRLELMMGRFAVGASEQGTLSCMGVQDDLRLDCILRRESQEEVPAWCDDQQAFLREAVRQAGDCQDRVWRRIQYR